MAAADEQQLIVQAKDGNHAAFRQLVDRYMKHAYDVAYGFVRNHDDADDIAQEAFVRVHRSLPSFRGDSGFGTWLYRIVTNLSVNRLKQKKRTTAMDAAGLDAVVPHAGPDVGQADVKMHVERALGGLTTVQRAVVVLRHIDGLSTRQVGQVLRCSEGTVKTHLHRGMKKMREMLRYMKEEGL